MNIKKALGYVAFGFLFTLVNFNLTLNGASLNVMPDFVGWILFFLSFALLGRYVEGKGYLRWIALLLAIFTAAIWLLEISGAAFDLNLLRFPSNVIATVFMFIYSGCIRDLARDYGASQESTISMLRYVNAACQVLLTIVGLLSRQIKLETLAVIVVILGAVALVAAIFTMVTLFGLRKEVSSRIDSAKQSGE